MTNKSLFRIFLVLTIFLMIGFSACGNDSEKSVESKSELSLNDYKGKIVILDFWATWCPPCREGIPDLVELKEKYGDEDFEVIGISLDGVTRGGQTLNDVGPFIDDFDINYPIVLGDENIMNSYGGIRSIPTSFVIDREGNIVSSYVGLAPISSYEEDIRRIKENDLNDQKTIPAPNFTFPVVEAD